MHGQAPALQKVLGETGSLGVSQFTGTFWRGCQSVFSEILNLGCHITRPLAFSGGTSARSYGRQARARSYGCRPFNPGPTLTRSPSYYTYTTPPPAGGTAKATRRHGACPRDMPVFPTSQQPAAQNRSHNIRMRAPLLAALLSTAHGWSIGVQGTVDVLDPDGPNGTIDRWPLAENLTTAEALGGGISYAFDDKLCDYLLPMFPEETVLQEYTSFFFPFPKFVDCELLKRVVRRTMAGWAAANVNVRFFEVTSLCNLGQGAGILPPMDPLNTTVPQPPFSPPGAPPAPPSPPMAPPPPSPPPPTSPPPLPPGNESLGWPAPPPPELPSECDLAIKSCWSCEYAELGISWFIPGATVELAMAGNLSDLALGDSGPANASAPPMLPPSARVFFTNVRQDSPNPRTNAKLSPGAVLACVRRTLITARTSRGATTVQDSGLRATSSRVSGSGDFLSSSSATAGPSRRPRSNSTLRTNTAGGSITSSAKASLTPKCADALLPARPGPRAALQIQHNVGPLSEVVRSPQLT